MDKLVKYIKPALFGLVFLLVLIFMARIFGENADDVKNTKDSAAVGFGFVITYTLFYIAIVAVLTMVLNGLRNKPKAALISLIGLVAIVIFYFIGYAADAGELPNSYTKGGVINTESDSKMVGGILNATLIVLLIAIGFSVIASFKQLINRLNG